MTTQSNRLWAVLLALALSACAAVSRSSQSEPTTTDAAHEDPELGPALAELQARKAELARHRGANDCGEVCRLSDLICSAGLRICQIATRHEGDAEYARHCRDAELDCRAGRAQCEDCKSGGR